MTETELLIGWPAANPWGFWCGFILPALFSVSAFAYCRIRLGEMHRLKYLFLTVLCAGVVDLAIHMSWLWPDGIVPEGNLAGGMIVAGLLLVPSIVRDMQHVLPAPHPIESFWMAWAALFITDVLTSAMQPGGVSRFAGIGAGGLHDGLFLAPVMTCIFTFLIRLTFTSYTFRENP